MSSGAGPWTIPRAAMAELIRMTDTVTQPSSPLAFLVDETPESPDEGRRLLLETGVISEAQNVDPSVLEALGVLARPTRVVTAVQDLAGVPFYEPFFLSGDRAVFGTFTSGGDCVVGAPMSAAALVDGLVDQVGRSPVGEGPEPVRIALSVLHALWALESVGLDADPPLTEDLAVAVLQGDSAAEADGRALLDALVSDQILSVTDGTVAVHPRFAPWRQAIRFSRRLVIYSLTADDGALAIDPAGAAGLLFVGSRGDRVCVWPPGDSAEDVVLAQLRGPDLEALMGSLVEDVSGESSGGDDVEGEWGSARRRWVRDAAAVST